MQVIPIHFDVPDHRLSLDTFLETARQIEATIDGLNQGLFDGELEYQVFVEPPRPGSLLVTLGMSVLAIGGTVWAFLESDIGQAFVKGLTRHEPSYWAEQAGRYLKDQTAIPPVRSHETLAVSKEGAPLPPPPDRRPASEDASAEEISRKTTELIVVEATKSFLLKPPDELNRIGVNTGIFRSAYQARNSFYLACIEDENVQGIGFDEAETFPIKRSDFSGFQVPLRKRSNMRLGAEAAKAADAPTEEPIFSILPIDQISIEIGPALLALISGEGEQKLADRVKSARRQLASEAGFIMPPVRITDSVQLPSKNYIIRVKEIVAGQGEIRPEHFLCMDPQGEPIRLPGEETVEPTFGLPAMWIAKDIREEALLKGYTVVDPLGVVVTHLMKIIREHMPELLSYSETQKLLDELSNNHKNLIAEVVPKKISVIGLQRVLQRLLGERVSIRDLPTILEGVLEATAYTSNVDLITEHVRGCLARQISSANMNDAGYIPLITLSPNWEQAFADSIIGDGEDKQFTMPPSKLQEFSDAVRDTFERYTKSGESPVLLTSPGIRAYVRSVVERFRPSTIVMSQKELQPKVVLKTLGQI